ncbi:MAG TPA: glycosyltransferase [Solirubrobacteraceae bacterium]
MASHVRSVLFVAPEPLRPSLTGPARRTVMLAGVVAEHCDVTLAAPSPSVFPDGPFRTLDIGPQADERLDSALARHDVVVVQQLPSPRLLLRAARHAPRLVVDLLAPFALEVAEIADDLPRRRALVRWHARAMVSHLAAADFVLCSNERQRDLLIGAGLAAGLLDPGVAGPALHERIAVVPHGLEPEPPRTGPPALRTGELGAQHRIAVWGGGIWAWFDPLTAVRAVEQLRPTHPDLRLAFVGLEHPDPAARAAHAPLAEEVRAYVRDRGLEETVIFRPRWLARDEYMGCIAEADVAISLHGTTLEGRFASRTRILDYLSARLPVVCSTGDAMSEYVDRGELGRVIAPGDVEGCATALAALLTGERRRISPDALTPLLWPSVARPLVDYCVAGAPRPDRGVAALAARAASDYPALARGVLAADGATGLARRVAARAASALRR